MNSSHSHFNDSDDFKFLNDLKSPQSEASLDESTNTHAPPQINLNESLSHLPISISDPEQEGIGENNDKFDDNKEEESRNKYDHIYVYQYNEQGVDFRDAEESSEIYGDEESSEILETSWYGLYGNEKLRATSEESQRTRTYPPKRINFIEK